MAVFSRAHNYLFLANPLTGSRAMAKTLIDKAGGEQIPAKELKRDGKLVLAKHHTTAKMLLAEKLLTEAELAAAFKFTTVRNPFDMLVSRYLRLRGLYAKAGAKTDATAGAKPGKAGKPGARKNEAQAARVEQATSHEFPRWVAEAHQDFIVGSKVFRGPTLFTEGVDHVIRFEKLQAGFDEVMKKVGVTQPVELLQINPTPEERAAAGKRPDYHAFYDLNTISLVQRLYAPVIEQFGYSFDFQ